MYMPENINFNLTQPISEESFKGDLYDTYTLETLNEYNSKRSYELKQKSNI